MEASYANSTTFHPLQVVKEAEEVVFQWRRGELLSETRKFEWSFSTADPHRLMLMMCLVDAARGRG